MKNISKTDKKILNEFEINYLVLLLNASISKLNSNSEIVSDEYSNLIEVLKAFDYVDKNLEKQDKNIDKNYIKKHLNLYYLFLEDEKTINQVKEINTKIFDILNSNQKNITYNDFTKELNKYIKNRLEYSYYIENLIYYLKDDVLLLYKYLDSINRESLMNELVFSSLPEKVKIKYISLIDINFKGDNTLYFDFDDMHELLLTSHTEYIKFLSQVRIIDLEVYDVVSFIPELVDSKKYDMISYLLKNVTIDKESVPYVFQFLLEQTPQDDKKALNSILLSTIKNKNFPMINKECLDIIKNCINDSTFGKKELLMEPFISPLVVDEDIKTLNILYSALTEVNFEHKEDYLVRDELLKKIKGLIVGNVKSYNYINYLVNELNKTKKCNEYEIDKEAFAEELMSSLIDKTPMKLQKRLLKTYDEIVNEDKSIQEQRLIKTLKKILNKSDRKII